MAVEIRDEVGNLFVDLAQWVNNGSRQDVDKGVKDIAKDIREKILQGQGADGAPLRALSEATLEGPVRLDHIPTIRKTFGSIPLNASGKTANSISGKKVGSDEWEVSSDTSLGDAILASNAKSVHHGNAFGGDTPKPVRDPLQVTDKQLDILEDSLVNGIDKALNG